MTEQEFLSSYSIENYPRPSLTVDMVVFGLRRNKDNENVKSINVYGLQVLLIKRANYPFKDKYALPGGFCVPHETVEQTALRELKEETNIDNASLKLINVFSKQGRDPRGWIISNVYRTLINKDNVVLRADTDAWEAKWFDVEFEENYVILKNNEEVFNVSHATKNFAFDHDEILYNVILSFKEDIVKDLTILLDFFNDKFTIGEVKTAYKIITNNTVDNFRRNILPYVQELDEYSVVKGYRPAKLYMKKIR